MRISRLTSILIACAAFSSASVARASVLIYNIVQGQSSLSVSGTLAGSTLTGQTGSSLTTSYTGTIKADVTATTITFPGGSSINAANVGNMQPDEEGLPGSQQANYGFQSNLSPFPNGLAAIREFSLDLTSAAINFAGTSIPSQQMVAVSNGFLDYSAISFGQQDMFGDTGGNGNAAAGSLTLAGSTETLTIPVNFTIAESTAITNDTVLTFTGTLVATRLVPEPASLGGVALIALASLRRRRH